MAWEWDERLYAGAARHYPSGRVPYPDGVARAIRTALDLDGHGRLLDVGCGPGSLTLQLAPLVEQAVGLDPDPDMLGEADRLARVAGVTNVVWVRRRAEELPADLGSFRLVAFAQSFHWTQREQVAAAVHRMLESDGACLLVHATTHRGVDSDVGERPLPSPPHRQVDELIRSYLGPAARAGRSLRPAALSSDEEARAEQLMRTAGFHGPQRLDIPAGPPVVRSEDQIVASVFSLSSSAPHLFGARIAAFEADLRRLLRQASPSGEFSDVFREITIDIWRP